jgi:hypothetical protein
LRVPPRARDCVVFLGYEEDGETHVGGTGFVVDVPSEGHPERLHWPYLVTSRRVAEGLERTERYFVRVNEFHQGATVWREPHWQWDMHPDRNVDLAILPWLHSDSRTQEVTQVPFDELSPSENRGDRSLEAGIGGVEIGDEIFVVGVFASMAGKQKNDPIVRTGAIAMAPVEPVSAEVGRDASGNAEFGEVDAYLIEARSPAGSSGSPVWVRESLSLEGKDEITAGVTRFQAQGDIHFLGMISGRWNTPTDRPDYSAVNAGISVVVKAKAIRDRLLLPAHVEERRRWDAYALRDRPAGMEGTDQA